MSPLHQGISALAYAISFQPSADSEASSQSLQHGARNPVLHEPPPRERVTGRGRDFLASAIAQLAEAATFNIRH